MDTTPDINDKTLIINDKEFVVEDDDLRAEIISLARRWHEWGYEQAFRSPFFEEAFLAMPRDSVRFFALLDDGTPAWFVI